MTDAQTAHSAQRSPRSPTRSPVSVVVRQPWLELSRCRRFPELAVHLAMLSCTLADAVAASTCGWPEMAHWFIHQCMAMTDFCVEAALNSDDGEVDLDSDGGKVALGSRLGSFFIIEN